jgi:DNA-binding beta-propeller fold protein YncE
MSLRFFLKCLLAKSYNQPKLSLCALWNPNATTFVDESSIGQQPVGIYINTENTIYAADRQNGRVLMWQSGSSISTRNVSENLINPWSLFVTMHGDIYVDNGGFNNRIDRWMLNATNSEPVMSVRESCTGLFVVDVALYCSSANEHHVVKIEFNSGVMTPNTVAGSGCPGPGSDTLDHPHGIFVDINFYLYIADTDNNRIQLFAPDQLNGTTLAGFGAAVYFILNGPTSVVLDADGYLFIVESRNHRIIRSVLNGFQCLVGCSGKSGATSSQLHNPQTMAFNSDGTVFVTDMDNHRIQKFALVVNTCGMFFRVCIEYSGKFLYQNDDSFA